MGAKNSTTKLTKGCQDVYDGLKECEHVPADHLPRVACEVLKYIVRKGDMYHPGFIELRKKIGPADEIALSPKGIEDLFSDFSTMGKAMQDYEFWQTDIDVTIKALGEDPICFQWVGPQRDTKSLNVADDLQRAAITVGGKTMTILWESLEQRHSLVPGLGMGSRDRKNQPRFKIAKIWEPPLTDGRETDVTFAIIDGRHRSPAIHFEITLVAPKHEYENFRDSFSKRAETLPNETDIKNFEWTVKLHDRRNRPRKSCGYRPPQFFASDP